MKYKIKVLGGGAGQGRATRENWDNCNSTTIKKDQSVRAEQVIKILFPLIELQNNRLLEKACTRDFIIVLCLGKLKFKDKSY